MARRTPLSRTTVGALVRGALGKRGTSLTGPEMNRLVRAFVAAGRRAVQIESGTARQAAEAIGASNELRARARHALARRTFPGHPAVLLAPGWRGPGRALRDHGPRFMRYPGVLGYGLSTRAGSRSGRVERCVTVLVSSELTDDEARQLKRRPPPVTLRMGRGKRIPIELVPVSRLRRQFVAGSSLGPAQTLIKGTLGAFAVDQASGASVALTAMHVVRGFSRFVVPTVLRVRRQQRNPDSPCGPTGGKSSSASSSSG